jgi:hypothetical protein
MLDGWEDFDEQERGFLLVWNTGTIVHHGTASFANSVLSRKGRECFPMLPLRRMPERRLLSDPGTLFSVTGTASTLPIADNAQGKWGRQYCSLSINSAAFAAFSSTMVASLFAIDPQIGMYQACKTREGSGHSILFLNTTDRVKVVEILFMVAADN